MPTSKSRLESEKKTIKTMVKMYCDKFHTPRGDFCQECVELFKYAEKRLEYCRFGENKPTCEKCPIHCYQPEMREKVRIIMRYAGPRMIYTHPIMGFRHLFKKIKKFENPQ
jgi:hypothetical protein